RVELFLRDPAALDERITKTIAAIDDRREADAPFVEKDRTEIIAMIDREASRLLPERNELQHVGERRFLEGSLDRHQRSSSMRREPGSGHSHTTFSVSRNAPSTARIALATGVV